MTHDPDAAPERAETAPEPATMPEAEHRAIDAAVAGVAGLLVGRALFGRAGGLVAGLAAVGAGLLAKRRPEAKKAAPEAAPLDGVVPAPEPVTAAAPVTQVRLETGLGTVDDNWAVLADAGLPGMSGFTPLTVAEEKPEPEPAVEPEDAGAFAEMPALFGTDEPRAITAPVPAVDIAAWKESLETVPVEEPVRFDEGPAPVEVNALPVAELVSRAEEALEKEVFPEPAPATPKVQTVPVPLMAFPGLLDDLPAEFSARMEEQEPGPREDFLLVPDQPAFVSPAITVPPIHTVVAALSESLEPPIVPAAPAAVESVAEPESDSKEESISVPVVSEEEALVLKSPFQKFELPNVPVLPGVPVSLVPAAAADPEPLAASPVEIRVPAKSDSVLDSPFRLWPVSSQPAALPGPPAGSGETSTTEDLPFPVAPSPSPTPAVPPPVAPAVPWGLTGTPEKTVPPVTTADPEDIWRQAAAEISVLRNSPLPPLATELPGTLPALTDEKSATPGFPSLTGSGATHLPPAALPQDPPLTPPLPPWMVPPSGEKAEPENPPEQPGQSPSGRKTFLPRIKLSVGQGPQPVPVHPPGPLLPEVPRAGEPAPIVAPTVLPGYKAEPMPPILPAQVSGRVFADINAALPGLPLLPLPAVSELPATPPDTFPPAPPVSAAGGKIPSPAEEMIFVPRAVSNRHASAPRKRGPITPARVGVLAVAAAAALGLAYKPELKELWDQKILGKSSAKSRSVSPPKPPVSKGVPGDASDVSIAPEAPVAPKRPPAETPAPAPEPGSEPAVPSAPLPETPPPTASPAPVSASPVTDPVAVTAAPPSADLESAGPLPVSEVGARELISRLIRATTPGAVKPYILEATRLEPALESYFSSGKALPVASYESHLERADVSAAGRTVWLFRVTTDTVQRGFPVGVEAAEDGLRTDWELFTQCRDGALQRFVDDASAPPGFYYVALKRAHMFPDMLPGSDPAKFFAFAVSSPALGAAPVNAFIPKGIQLATRADRLFKFGNSYAPVLELTHKDGHVEITGIKRENWRMASRGDSR